MKVKNCDKPFVTTKWTEGKGNASPKRETSTMWRERPVTEQDVEDSKFLRAELIDALGKCGDGEAQTILDRLTEVSVPTVSDGLAWTPRSAILSVLWSSELPNRPKDQPENLEDKRVIAKVALRVNDAGRDLTLADSEVELILRRAHEANIHPRVFTALFDVLENKK